VQTSSHKYLVVSVQDSGIGIAEENQKSLFKPFGKLENDVQKGMNPTGSGLGLSICKRIVEELGGCISVVSELGKGAKFTFTSKLEAITPQKLFLRKECKMRTQEKIKEDIKMENLQRKTKSHFFKTKNKNQFFSAQNS